MGLPPKRADRKIRLGVMDAGFMGLGSPAKERLSQTLMLAQRLDAAGYHRFWITEHHGGQAVQASPEALVPLLASRTQRIRVGTAVILLPFYAPLKVAQTGLVAQALFPGRIEVGVGRGPGAEQASLERLMARQPRALDPNVFADKVRELGGYLGAPAPETGPLVPRGVVPPAFWVMGGGPEAAALAGEAGAGFAFGWFIFKPEVAEARATAALAAYRASIAEHHPERAPRVSLALSCMCLDDDRSARAYDGKGGLVPHSVVGGPREVKAQIEDIARRHVVEDIVLQTSPLLGHDRLVASFETLARAFRLPREMTAAPSMSRA